jgi:chromate transport protein ChrA
MARGDITAFLCFGIIAVPCGLITALLFHRSRHPFLWTAAASGLGATVVGLVVVCVMQTVESMNDNGYSLGRAIQSGLAAAFILGFAMPFVCGGPAAFVGCIFQCVLQRRSRRCRRERPPPLPDVIR